MTLRELYYAGRIVLAENCPALDEARKRMKELMGDVLDEVIDAVPRLIEVGRGAFAAVLTRSGEMSASGEMEE